MTVNIFQQLKTPFQVFDDLKDALLLSQILNQISRKALFFEMA